jgi:hypothetical protein
MTWFRKGLEKGLSRDEAIIECLVHCGPAMLQTTAGISLAMLVLYPSDLVMISRFGWLMAALIAAAYVGDIVLLPVMLRGALGRRIEKAVLEERRLAALAAEAIEHSCAPELVDLRQDDAAIEATIPAPHLPLDKARTRRKRTAS